ncbi:MAG: ATP-binding protein [Pyrinomonadaceae bacterium]|nr:ATP-binding protein [Pyrinomonadaceae bacterium]
MSLFLKIFVWFWLAMAIVGSALVIAVALTESHQAEVRWRYMTGTAVHIYAQTAAEMYERDGPVALVIYLQRVEQTAQLETRMYDERGIEVSGRTSTTGTKRLAEYAEQIQGNNEPVFDFATEPKPVALVAQKVYGRGGARYVLVSELPRDRFAELFADPWTLLFRLGAVLLTAGLVCYGLARHLAAPVQILRAGVRRLAGGDLSVRVASTVGAQQDEFVDLSHDFDSMAERIESLIMSQRRLLGDISHELRSPLVRLRIALGLARRRADTEAPEMIGTLDRIEREAERLNELIEQLLTITRLETSPEEVEKTEIDLQNLIAQVVADADFEAHAHNRNVQVIAGEVCHVMGNVELLRSAIENVVRNGARYTAENTTVEVTLRCSQDECGAVAVISVRDYGTGVPEEALNDLFRPFYRVADARDRRTGGTGLGLAITERAVRLHGGKVQALNAPGGGLIVEIRLPVKTKKVLVNHPD